MYIYSTQIAPTHTHAHTHMNATARALTQGRWSKALVCIIRILPNQKQKICPNNHHEHRKPPSICQPKTNKSTKKPQITRLPRHSRDTLELIFVLSTRSKVMKHRDVVTRGLQQQPSRAPATLFTRTTRMDNITTTPTMGIRAAALYVARTDGGFFFRQPTTDGPQAYHQDNRTSP